jgi:hypothetical protein
MNVLGIDPGTDHSGVVLFDVDNWKIIASWNAMPNNFLRTILRMGRFEWRDPGKLDIQQAAIDELHIETIEAMGQIIGNETIKTAIWVGRMEEAWENSMNERLRDTGILYEPVMLVRRGDEKTILCGGSTVANPQTGRRQKVTDANIRAAVIARFPATGGGKVPQVGVKKQPGPLFGVKGHAWMALAVAITGMEIRKAEENRRCQTKQKTTM